MIEEETRVRAVDTQLSAPLGDDAVVLEFNAGIYYGMNEVAARVWQLVQQPRSIAEIRDVIVTEYEVDARDGDEGRHASDRGDGGSWAHRGPTCARSLGTGLSRHAIAGI